MRSALILGISGQDGAYLARHLLQQGYRVFGTMPDASSRRFRCLRALGIFDQVQVYQLSLQDFPTVLHILKRLRPDEIYDFSSQVACGTPEENLRVCEPDMEQGTQNALEAIRILSQGSRFLLATSGEASGIYTDAGCEGSFAPRSELEPAQKEEARACRQVAAYREKFGIFACTGIIYNRSSPLAPGNSLSRIITTAAVRIAAGYGTRLNLEHPDDIHEWGWAPEYADVMQRILQQDQPADFVIATGHAYTIRAFTEAVFASAGLNWQDHVDLSGHTGNSQAFIPADPTLTFQALGWKAEIGMEAVASLLVSSERISGLR